MPRLSKIGAAALAAFGWTGLQSVTVSYLVVAGGGAGGGGVASHGGSGGGAGGYRTGTASLNPSLSYTVTVGAGGAGTNSTGASGSDSTFNATTSAGGGGGVTASNVGVAGGSGSGGGPDGTPAAGGAGNTPSTSPVQGYAGGQGITDNASYSATGGGGGSSAVGAAGVNGQSGAGGVGTANSISGTSTYYAGGGGGGATTQSTRGTGGNGGGGNGASSGAGSSGTANLGGGGGGASVSGTTGGNGGSGVVIISYVGAQQFGGGVVTTDGTNTIHIFNTSGTLLPLSSLTAQYLVVGGGGGGASGGGGAGGFRTGTGVTIDTNSNYVITVGSGGSGGVGGSGTPASTNGANSVFLNITSAGGGNGARIGNSGELSGGSGGSGGGGGGFSNSITNGGSGNTPSTSPSQGNNGGSNGTQLSSPYPAGGGGGASAVGGNGSGGSISGNGGAGTASSISGSSVTYAGGGGGGSYGSGTAGTGGAGGGGAGSGTTTGTSGTAGTGGGGGGSYVSGTGGNGGSGVVIISYAGSTQQMAGGTVTISGGNVIHTFTSSGYLTPIKYASRSLRFRSTNNSYLNRTPAKASNQKTWTWSGWVKRGNLATGAAQFLFTAHSGSPWGGIILDSTNAIQVSFSAGVSGGTYTTALYRDPSAWYHIVVAVDTTQATASNRILIYVNGVVVTSFSATNYPSQNFDTQFNSAIAHYLGCSSSSTENFDGYLAEVNFIDGAALTPSSFGTFNSYGVWQPITYGGSYGTNGFYLTFGNNTSTTTLGYDTSPQGNNWTTNNISVTTGTTYDSMTDVPTLTSATVANYATWNPLRKDNISTIYLTNGNLTAQGPNYPSGAFMSTIASQGSGLWYAELTLSNTTYPTVAVADITVANISPSGSMNVSGVIAWDNSSYFINGSTSSSAATFASGDVLGIAFDGATRKVWFAKNNTWISSGNPAAGTNQIGIVAGTGPLAFACRPENSVAISANFGQQGFTYTPPSGFVALNTYNLSTPTIPNGATQMAATTYTGNGSTQSIVNTVNGTVFQPDWVWIKKRSAAASSGLFDVLRGAGVVLTSNITDAERNNGTGSGGDLIAFNSNGFNLGNNTTGSATDSNLSGSTYIGWQWKANGAGVSNTSGSITSTVSANPTAGFSVVTYTGTNTAATVGHGLGVTPSMIIVKQRNSGSENWLTYHSSLTNPTTSYLYLNSTAAQATTASYWNGGPTSSVFGIGAFSGINASAGTYVAYVFSAIAGYSAFGSYTGNGSSDGPFVYTGFRPRFVLVKHTNDIDSWFVWDSSRISYNAANLTLKPNSSDAEESAYSIDTLSNGFKIRTSDVRQNTSGGTYIYACFAENPFKYANAR